MLPYLLEDEDNRRGLRRAMYATRKSRVLLKPGTRFGRLTVMRIDRSRWLCRCDCGNQCSVAYGALKRGNNRSCGCYHRERLISDNTKHGHSNSRTYHSWRAMMNRCYRVNQENYPRYGGRGITVCRRWHRFENFLKDMGVRPEGMTLDRKNNDRGYSKSNCRWATSSQQERNKRWTTKKSQT